MKLKLTDLGKTLLVKRHRWNDSDTKKLIGKQVKLTDFRNKEKMAIVEYKEQEIILHYNELAL